MQHAGQIISGGTAICARTDYESWIYFIKFNSITKVAAYWNFLFISAPSAEIEEVVEEPKAASIEPVVEVKEEPMAAS